MVCLQRQSQQPAPAVHPRMAQQSSGPAKFAPTSTMCALASLAMRMCFACAPPPLHTYICTARLVLKTAFYVLPHCADECRRVHRFKVRCLAANSGRRKPSLTLALPPRHTQAAAFVCTSNLTPYLITCVSVACRTWARLPAACAKRHARGHDKMVTWYHHAGNPWPEDAPSWGTLCNLPLLHRPMWAVQPRTAALVHDCLNVLELHHQSL